jgi:ubiquinone biosynthesis protein COQ4
MRDTHDLLHVLTGYGRDALGEACVLAFTYSQQPSHAHLFISYMAGLNMRKQSKARFGVTPPVLKATREGQKLGKACPRIVEQSIRELLAMPLDAARAKLNITPARWYHEAHKTWQANGADPYDLLAEKKAA